MVRVMVMVMVKVRVRVYYTFYSDKMDYSQLVHINTEIYFLWSQNLCKPYARSTVNLI